MRQSGRKVSGSWDTANPLQDPNYFYDAVGNITYVRNDAEETIFFDGTFASPDSDYTYDAIYRLIKAKGREHEGNSVISGNPDPDSWSDGTRVQLAHPNDKTKMRPYIQYYAYDKVGNMTQLRHTTTDSTYNWTRDFTINGANNRMTASDDGMVSDSYIYDSRGNLTEGMSHMKSLYYNESNVMYKSETNAGVKSYYNYAGSQRMRKATKNGSNKAKERIYFGTFEQYREFDSSGTITLERVSEILNDGTGTTVFLDNRTAGSGTEPSSMKRYQYSNHLGTATLELDEDADIISYEEYYPFGCTSFQSGRTAVEVSLKHYRYCGKERDEETGLYYMGARYYIPWLCRWCAVDPLESEFAGMSSYNYCFNNPIVHNDLSGMKPGDPPKGWVKADSRDDSFNNDGTNRFGFKAGYVDEKGDGHYKKYTNEEYWAKFGGNKEFRPRFSANNPDAGKKISSPNAGSASTTSAKQAPPPPPNDNGIGIRLPQSNPKPTGIQQFRTGFKQGALENLHALKESLTTPDGIAKIAVGAAAVYFIPVLGELALALTFGYMLYKAASAAKDLHDGNFYKAGKSTGSLTVDAATMLATEGVIRLRSGAKPASQYSVAFEMELPTTLYPGKDPYAHFRAANNALADAMAADAEFANTMKQLGINVPRTNAGTVTGKKIPDWVWNHATVENDGKPGVMQLVPQAQHTPGSIFWPIFHNGPGRQGGMAQWGGGYK